MKSDAKQVLSQRDLGKANQYRLLQALVDHGPQSRAELARVLSVSRASVGAITNGLIDSGVLTEEHSGRPTGRGKPPVPVWFSKNGYLAGAISIEAEQVRVGCVNARGDILSMSSAAFDQAIGKDELTHVVVGLAEQVFSEFDGEINTVGVVVPAQCLPRDLQIERSTILPALTRSSLPVDLSRALGVEVALEQDVRALASAERWFGAGRGQPSFAVLQVDYGVGLGVVINGSLFPGTEQSSPQFGHLPADPHGHECTCGGRGCWETVASIKWLERSLSEYGISAVEAIRGEDPDDSHEVLDQYFAQLSVGLSGLAHIINTPVIILQGALREIGVNILVDLQAALTRRCGIVEPPVLRVSTLGADALVLGAGAVALSRALGVTL